MLQIAEKCRAAAAAGTQVDERLANEVGETGAVQLMRVMTDILSFAKISAHSVDRRPMLP